MRSDGATKRRSDEGNRSNETIRALRAVAPSLMIDERALDELDERLSRYPFGASGIDWSRASALVEATLKATSSAEEFIRAAIRELRLPGADRVLLIGDNLFEESLSLAVSDLEACVAILVQLPLGFIVGPLDGTWDWVIDVRFAGAAWAGKAPEVIK